LHLPYVLRLPRRSLGRKRQQECRQARTLQVSRLCPSHDRVSQNWAINGIISEKLDDCICRSLASLSKFLYCRRFNNLQGGVLNERCQRRQFSCGSSARAPRCLKNSRQRLTFAIETLANVVVSP